MANVPGYIFPKPGSERIPHTRSYRYYEDDKLEYWMNWEGAVIVDYWERMSMTAMLDPNRLKRNHVVNVRGHDGKFWVVVTDQNESTIWEISWERWVKEGCNALKD